MSRVMTRSDELIALLRDHIESLEAHGLGNTEPMSFDDLSAVLEALTRSNDTAIPGPKMESIMRSAAFAGTEHCYVIRSNASLTEETSDEPVDTEVTEEMIGAVARAICEEDGYDPDHLEPGDDPYQERDGMPSPCIDGYNRKDEPCHFFWRKYDIHARAAITAMRAAATRPSVLGDGEPV